MSQAKAKKFYSIDFNSTVNTWRNDIQHNVTHHIDIRHNATQHERLVYDTQHNNALHFYADCHYGEYCSFLLFAECRYNECHSAECRGALI
jgi:hypothetical protein